ncbi:TetR/AcrR family transcriptional regulator [Kutzneria albida]|uniref:TetR family transcription regulator n=1 Tax=Kutzneria albida DSM 43870 TaxID=1449976 RepID=W5W823_9PSEU|nr:TetR/AcrR family transcriptional regulator [Kutzneria albida]AHH96661.1 TetR family transcription regulator [Kutzneria albida DSM 43870]
MTSSTRRRLSPEQRRSELLGIGARLFAQRPYEEVWIEEVAELAGVSRGLLYHYFATKRDFFAAIVREESEQLYALSDPDPALPNEQRLAAALDVYLDYVQQHEHGFRAVHRGAASADEGIRAIVREGQSRQAERIMAALAPGELGAEVLRLAVRGWFSFLTTVCLDWLDNPEISREQLRDLCARTLLSAVS